jgi:hypothetical protein
MGVLPRVESAGLQEKTWHLSGPVIYIATTVYMPNTAVYMPNLMICRKSWVLVAHTYNPSYSGGKDQ